LKVSGEPRCKGNRLADPKEAKTPRKEKNLGTFSEKQERGRN